MLSVQGSRFNVSTPAKRGVASTLAISGLMTVDGCGLSKNHVPTEAIKMAAKSQTN